MQALVSSSNAPLPHPSVPGCLGHTGSRAQETPVPPPALLLPWHSSGAQVKVKVPERPEGVKDSPGKQDPDHHAQAGQGDWVGECTKERAGPEPLGGAPRARGQQQGAQAGTLSSCPAHCHPSPPWVPIRDARSPRPWGHCPGHSLPPGDTPFFYL